MLAGGCELLLVGEQVRPEAKGVLLHSADGGRNAKVVASFPEALHISGIARAGGWLWIAGDLRSGRAFIARARTPRSRWRRVAAPAWLVSVSSIAVARGTVWIAGQKETTHGLEALVLAGRSGHPPFRVAARIRPALGRAAFIHELDAVGAVVVAAGTDSINGVVLASDDAGDTFYRVSTPRRLSAANGAAAIAGHGYVAGASGVRAEAWGELLSTYSGKRAWHARRLAGSVAVADVAFVTPSTGYLVALTGRGSDFRVTADAGRSWRVLRRSSNVFLERLLPGQTTYAVGVSGLYRVATR